MYRFLGWSIVAAKDVIGKNILSLYLHNIMDILDLYSYIFNTVTIKLNIRFFFQIFLR